MDSGGGETVNILLTLLVCFNNCICSVNYRVTIEVNQCSGMVSEKNTLMWQPWSGALMFEWH
jgi:hypothetical protein